MHTASSLIAEPHPSVKSAQLARMILRCSMPASAWPACGKNSRMGLSPMTLVGTQVPCQHLKVESRFFCDFDRNIW